MGVFTQFLIDRNPRFKEHRINEGCECDDGVLVNQVHRFAVFARSLAVFLCFNLRAFFRVFSSWWFGSLKIGVGVKSVRRIGRGAFAQCHSFKYRRHIVQELCESRGGRPGLSVLTNLPVSVDVKQY